MSKFSKNIGRLGVLTAMTVSLLKCNGPANTQKTNDDKEKSTLVTDVVNLLKKYNIEISEDQANAIVNILNEDLKKLNETNIQKFIDILKEKNILKEENDNIVINGDAFKTENGKVILNTDIVKIEELKKAISKDNSFKAIDVNVLKETLKTFFKDNFQTEIDDIVDDLANFLSESQYFNISYIEKEYENKEAIKNVFVKLNDEEIGLVLVNGKKINDNALKEGKLTDEIKKEIEEKLKALLKKEPPKKEEDPKKEEEETLKKIDNVAKEKNIIYNSEKGFTDQDWKTICSGNKFSFEDIKNHLPEKTVFKMRETVMNIIKSMDDVSADKVLEITKFFNNFKFTSKEISEVLGSLKDNNVDDFIQLNDDQKHTSANFLTIINKFKSKLSNDDAEKLRNYLDGNLSTDDFKNTFSNKLDVSDDEYNALIISYCGIKDINQVTIPPFKGKVLLSILKGFDKSKKISNTQNFINAFGKVSSTVPEDSNMNGYTVIKEFIQPSNNLSILISIFEKKSLEANDVYDIWNNLFTDQVDFNPATHKALIELVKEGVTLDNSRFTSKKATMTFDEWLNSTDNTVICAIDKVGFTDNNGTAIAIDDTKMKSALDKINAVKTDPQLNKDNIVTFITNASYQDKLTKDHIGVLKNIFGTDFKTKVLKNAGYTKFSITIKDLADKIGNQSLTSSEVKTLFSTKCNDWDTEKVKTDIVTRIGTVSNNKKLKHVFEVLSGADLTAANAVTIGKVCEKKDTANPVNDVETLSQELVAVNGGLDEFINALKNDDKKIQPVFTALNGAKLTAANAVKIAEACTDKPSLDGGNTLAAAAGAFIASLDAGANQNKVAAVFGALNGKNLTAANAVTIAKACKAADDAPVTDAKRLATELATVIASRGAFLGALKNDEKKISKVFGQLGGANLTAANAVTIAEACDKDAAAGQVTDAEGLATELATVNASLTAFLNALADKKISTVFGQLGGANITAAQAATIAIACNKDTDNSPVTSVAGLGTELATQNVSRGAFLGALKNDEKKISTVFGALVGANLTAANAVTIAEACTDGPTKNAGGTELANAAAAFIASLDAGQQTVAKVFKGLYDANVKDGNGLTAVNAAKIACALNTTVNKGYDNNGKKDLVNYLTDPAKQDDLEYFFKSLKNDAQGDQMKAVSDALKGNTDYTLAQVLKILVHCSDFNAINYQNVVTSFSFSANKNNSTDGNLATVFNTGAGDGFRALKCDSTENGQKMFTAWELARIIAKTTDKGITDANAAVVLSCLQNAYRKLDIVFYELAYCKIDGNYDFSADGGPSAADGNRGKLPREACFALAQACHKAGVSTDALNYKDGDTSKIFTDGDGGYDGLDGDTGYLGVNKNRYKDLWLNNGGATKKYGNTDVFPITKLGAGTVADNVDTDLYAIIGAVCTANIGTAGGNLDFSKDNWTA